MVVVAFLLCFSSSAFAADVQKQIQDKMQEAIGQESENSFVGNPLETGQVAVSEFPDYADRIATEEQPSSVSVEDSFPIMDVEDLETFRDRVNKGETTLNGHLMANIDLDFETWTPIGTSTNPYQGVFDGRGFRIEGLYVVQSSTSPAGLFAFTDGALIENLGIEGKINGGSRAGGIVGSALDTSITNCYNKCTVIGYGPSGGLVGGLSGESVVASCCNKGIVSDTNINEEKASFNGGICGVIEGSSSIFYCYNIGTITVSQGAVGGIVGCSARESLVISCYNIGEIGKSGSSGGIVGFATDISGVLNCCYLQGATPGIGGDMSAYEHKIYYGTSENMKTSAFITFLNGGEGEFFVADGYNINNGYPVLSWEKPALPSYKISVSNEIIVSKTKAEPGETIQLLAPKENFIGWKSTPSLEIATGELSSQVYGMFTMPDSAVTITAQYKSSTKFQDVPDNAWFAPFVYDLAGQGILNGRSDTIFDPDGNITRGEFAKILAYASQDDLSQYKGTSNFADSKGHWSETNINWAYQNGIVKGQSETTFAPNAKITRQEMAVMIKRYADYKGIDLPKSNQAVTFVDDGKIAAWAKAEVTAMQQAGIINGRPGNLFDPEGNASRAEAAKMISVLLDL